MLLAKPSQHLVRRPMSILDEGDGWRSYMVKPVGPATRELVATRVGDPLEASEPLGNGFPLPEELGPGPLLLVGGGFGIAPLHFLARRLDAMRHPPKYSILYGGRTARDVEREVLDDVLGPVLPSTDDGTLGFHGTCVDLCVREVERMEQRTASAVVLTCGPHAMMRALFDAVQDRVPTIHVSLEEIMACGVGVCMGCVAHTREGYVPICTHGPVFAAGEIFGFEHQLSHGESAHE
ncbi:MAG: dihydroorotate dehydrogenase electron transfer subunit [Candidatus Latescibacterota bacterium]|nr:MAG: dihydroorotate dehydrogenase electron transfer subunit [Candidatus Latescibacterota bacterium]